MRNQPDRNRAKANGDRRSRAAAARTLQQCLLPAVAALGLMAMQGCGSAPLVKYSVNTPPMVLAPVSAVGVVDGRSRFREIYCAVAGERGALLPDHRPCEEALVRLADEAPASGESVDLGASRAPLHVLVVPGLGWQCFKGFVDPKSTIADHLARFGHKMTILDVDALSGSGQNARQIRDAVMAMDGSGTPVRLVLLGYSKGIPDILEALTTYPELQDRVAAVVSVAGAVGGSPLANETSQSTADLFQYVPGAECNRGDGGALESLKPGVRQRFLASHTLPGSIRYYSVVTYPDPDNISAALRSAYDQLSRVDSRNDSQLIFYDQVIPAGVLLAYVNADHLAVGVPINRSRPLFASVFLDRNAFPREILTEAILRYVEEDLTPDRRPPKSVSKKTQP